uniref:Transmembrane protein C17orf113 homolog isoform X5 n=1 Tax=Geotrypetes seraphini TaxID=260995 RepID=A0A6P8NYZ1_GEOSA|nr:transmembrane protein C17orf113 homolog isoform X5 [Geotrypetes seraphini]
MKRPLNPSHPPGNRLTKLDHEITCSDCQPTLEDQSVKKDKRQSFTLCKVCNIQLNSTAQAEIHYNGKSHQKRLKRLYHRKVSVKQGTIGSNSLLPSTLRVPGQPLQVSLDIKQLLAFRLNENSTLGIFPNFSAMDPVQKAVINHTFGAPLPLKRKQFISCNLCHLRFNSLNQAEAHYKGHKHGRKLKAMEAMKQKEKGTATNREKAVDFSNIQDLDKSGYPDSAVLLDNLSTDAEVDHSTFILTPNSEGSSSLEMSSIALSSASPSLSESSGALDDTSSASDKILGTEVGTKIDNRTEIGKEDKKKIEHLYCATCKVAVNSASQLQAHNIGAKHKSMLRGQNTQTKRWKAKFLSRLGHRSKRMANKKSSNVRSKAFHCSVCGIYVNSETQLKQHMNSRRHRDRLAGNPSKTKYSLHPKLLKTASLALNCRNLHWKNFIRFIMEDEEDVSVRVHRRCVKL